MGQDPTQATFSNDPGADWTVTSGDIVSILDGNNLTLQANTDITVETAVDASGNAGNGDLALEAGRSILIDNDVLVNGSFTATANAEGALPAYRDPGDARAMRTFGYSIVYLNGIFIFLLLDHYARIFIRAFFLN